MQKRSEKFVINTAKRKGKYGYRVNYVGKNGRILNTTQVLDTTAAVNNYLRLARKAGSARVIWKSWMKRKGKK